ncbi:MAG: hypothetical protein HOF23_03395 [Rhodospirillaceae bacterium]|nr:hypothetical protein [Rhodospirillaceae bacterium]
MTYSNPPDPVPPIDGDNFNSVEYDPPDRDPVNVPSDVFELGLVMAGAVSAGAYIAGVMDFLIEALDVWEQKKAEPGFSGPKHRTLLKVITGASGGAMNGAIAVANLNHKFKHIRSGETAGQTENPFFDAWVNDIDISLLLALEDLSGDNPEIRSILDSTELDAIARRSLTPPPDAEPIERGYLNDPLRLMLTVTNLRGIPHWIGLSGNTKQGHGMLMHRDHLRFALQGPSNGGLYPDELHLQYPADMSSQSWVSLAKAALATGAFPAFLKPRDISRPFKDYKFRNVFKNVLPETKKYRAVQAAKYDFSDGEYNFLAVDGGTMNNEPLEMARRVLAGAFGRNPRDGLKAKRATIMIDPFPEMPSLGPENGLNINPVSSVMALASAWKSESRFRAQDLALAGDNHVYSRFLLAPSRRDHDQISRGARITSEALGAFGGFLSRHFRVHDYLLGRRNCQRFLSHNFTLPEQHQLFKSWDINDRQDYLVPRHGDQKDHLPIIPLIKGSAVEAEEPIPSWPTGLYDRSSIEPLIEQRFDAIFDAAMKKLEIPWYQKLYLKPLKWAARNKLCQFASEKIAADLDRMNL